MTDSSPKELLEQAESQVQSGNIAAAIALYRSIPGASPQARKARRTLKSLQKNNPGAVMEADLKQLVALHEAESHKQAMSLARQLSRSYPEQPLPHNVIGTVHMARGQFKEAARCFRRALELAPDFLDARNNLGAACNALEDYEEAITCFSQVIIGRPRDATAHANLGKAYRQSDRLEQAVVSYENALSLRPDDESAMLPLGETLMKLGEKEEALKWYRRTLEKSPDNVQANYEIGLLLLQTGNKTEAAQYMRKALELNPGSAEVEHFLAVAEGDVSKTAPAEYVASLFDGYASEFDDHLVKSLSYDAPRILHQLMLDSGALTSSVPLAIDLGCGTGLCGAEFRQHCGHLTGVDLSEKMIAVAEGKGLYDQLIRGDLVSALDDLGKAFDLFISADTFIYVGELTAVFQAVAAHANPGALFTFSTESGYEQDVELQSTGRYTHSHDYILRLAAGSGFDIVSYREQNLRTETKQWLQGGYYVLRQQG